MDFLSGLVVFVVGAWAGWNFRGAIMLHAMSENPEKIISMLEQVKKINQNTDKGLPEDVTEVEAEYVNGVVYAYAKDNGEFLAQAASLHQALVLAAKRFPDRKFWHPDLKKDSQTA